MEKVSLPLWKVITKKLQKYTLKLNTSIYCILTLFQIVGRFDKSKYIVFAT
jgi:hypothetical protein